MKQLLILAFTLISFIGFGQTDNAKIKDIKRLLTVSGAASAAKAGVEGMAASMKARAEQNSLPEGFWDEFLKSINYEEVAELYVPIYDKNYSHQEIIDLIKITTGNNYLNSDTDIYHDLDLVGDDFHDLIEIIATKYQIDMTGYLWYFHADEEGQNLGGIFFKPPYARVKRIAITPRILTEIANKQKWDLPYPIHKLPARRYDLIFNKIFFGTITTLLLVILYKKYSE